MAAWHAEEPFRSPSISQGEGSGIVDYQYLLAEKPRGCFYSAPSPDHACVASQVIEHETVADLQARDASPRGAVGTRGLRNNP